MLVFNYAVKYCGKYYPANTPIADTAQKPAETARDAFAEKGKEEPSPKPETARDAFAEKGKEEPSPKPETAQKPARARKKGDA